MFILLSYLSQLVFPSNEFVDVESGSLDVMRHRRRRIPGDLLHRGLRRRVHRVGADLAGLGGPDPVRHGPRRHPAADRCSATSRPRFSTPVYAILVVSAISLLAIEIDLATLASIISFGALVAFSAVNLSVIKHYFIDLRERGGVACCAT